MQEAKLMTIRMGVIHPPLCLNALPGLLAQDNLRPANA
jgi:hypothetical protein